MQVKPSIVIREFLSSLYAGVGALTCTPDVTSAKQKCSADARETPHSIEENKPCALVVPFGVHVVIAYIVFR